MEHRTDDSFNTDDAGGVQVVDELFKSSKTLEKQFFG